MEIWIKLYSILMENQVISDLEMENPNVLFYHKNGYNRVLYLNNLDKKVFLMMSQNFFRDMKDVHSMKIKTLKYWFLHNLSLLFEKDVTLTIEFENIAEEIDILIDYFRVIMMKKESKVDRYIFLPCMRLFSNWCNVSNSEKIDIHHNLIRDLIYLDDNYFFLINYFKNHNIKFVVNIVKNKSEMDKGNNIMIHLIRSAMFKNCECSYKNFKKIMNYLMIEVWENKFMEIMMKKNNKGKRALNLLVYLNEEFYEFMLNKIFTVSSHKEFMDKYFSAITKYINHSFQLEIILDNVDMFFPDKYIHLYQKLLTNKIIQYYEKYMIINLLRSYNLVSIEEDREKLGRKLWEQLHVIEVSE